jgi:soluble cytochrome b562
VDKPEKKRLYNEIDKLSEKVDHVLIKLENGILREVKKNTKSIDGLCNDINNIQEKFQQEEGEKGDN